MHKIKYLVLLSAIFMFNFTPNKFQNFVTRSGDKLMDGSQELRFVSFNVPNLHYIEDYLPFSQTNPWRLPNEYEITDALKSINQLGGKVTRIYTPALRKPTDDPAFIRHIEAPGKFNEEAFRAYDIVLKKANELGVRVIIPLVDNWVWWGGPGDYAAFRGLTASDFWKDTTLLSDMKKTISYMLNRRNTLTGELYKDDKAILGWETGNELDIHSDWTTEMARYIKSIDKNHLVIEGRRDALLAEDAIDNPYTDVLTTHFYCPAKDAVKQILINLNLSKGKKPYFVGEVGFMPTKDLESVIDTVIKNNASGVLLWSLRFRNREGGFYHHTENEKYSPYRWPGFASGNYYDETGVFKLMREKAYQINSASVPSLPAPDRPQLLEINNVNEISWQGSTGASSYIIERNEGSGWKVLADNVSDNDNPYRPLFADASAEPGKYYSYRVSAKNVTGVSAPSNVSGPVLVTCKKIIDELENNSRFFSQKGKLEFLSIKDRKKAKEENSRLTGPKGSYIIYSIPKAIDALSVETFSDKPDNSIEILASADSVNFVPLNVKKNIYALGQNEYGFFLPIAYSTPDLLKEFRYIKIGMNPDVQISRVEIQYGTLTAEELSKIKAKREIKIPSLFSDNMVLQQKTSAPFWGKAMPGTKIKITAGWGASAEGTAASDSSWKVLLQTPKAGGPFEIKLTAGEEEFSYKNVMTGEVFICSGQSNMEMPLEGWTQDSINNSAAEIRNANYPGYRMFSLTKAFSDKKEFDCMGSWIECSPATAGKFSATAYFFGRKIHEELKVPVGLINASWGGTRVESWINGKVLSSAGEFRDVLANLSSAREETARLTEWMEQHPVLEVSQKDDQNRWKNLDFNDDQCPMPSYDDSKWHEMKLPISWESAGLSNFDGVVWFRKKIEIPQEWQSKNLIIELGPIDDMDRAYVNGSFVGAMEENGAWQKDRVYTIPASLVTSGTLTVAVRVLDNQGGGGIWGNQIKMNVRTEDDSKRIALDGIWKYLPVAEYRNMKFYCYNPAVGEFFLRPKASIQLSAYTPTALYNAMIVPLIPYAIKGVIWYQGESNADNPGQYKKLFPMMINNWRDDWGQGAFPFYFVQIAPYAYEGGIRSQLLREAQTEALKLPNTGMAVTMDIGSAATIHPGNKQDVGNRLALWALAKDYKKKTVFSGPLYKSMKIVKNKIILSFEYADGGLRLKPSDGGNNFLIAGKDGKFVPAQVKVSGKKLIVSAPEISKPGYVRYGWSDAPIGSLFNRSGLPASSFRTDTLK